MKRNGYKNKELSYICHTSRITHYGLPEKMKTHKDLDVWKDAMTLTKEIYQLTADFPKEKTYGLVSQIRRAAVSIPSNIAKGAAINSNKEFIQFLYISLGSLAELETQLRLSRELGFLKNESMEKIKEYAEGKIKVESKFFEYNPSNKPIAIIEYIREGRSWRRKREGNCRFAFK